MEPVLQEGQRAVRKNTRYTKMAKGMGEKTYEERLQMLNLWTLEERRNRQDLIEVFKICKGYTRINHNNLYISTIMKRVLEVIPLN